MAARLVPWSVAGLSLVLLGVLVVLNPHLEAGTATITGQETPDERQSPPWILGVALIGVGAFAALVAMLREERYA